MLSKTIRTAGAALVAALVTAGIAIAASSGDNQGAKQRDPGPGAFQGGPGGPHRGPAGPPFLKDLTYAEVHAFKDGEAVVIRVDRGKVKSIASDSITITANDNSEVTIPIDENTRVVGPRLGPDAHVSDLKEGTPVIVDREQGQPAETIAVAPNKRKGPPGAPPGGQQGGSQEQSPAGGSSR